MPITSKRDALVKYLISEFKSKSKVKEFEEQLKYLDICDLTDDDDLNKVTSNGMIDSLKVLYALGTMSKLVEIKKYIKEQ